MDLTEPVLLTPEGLEKLKRDLEVALKRRAEAGERLKEAFQPGDIEDNPEYEQAKEEVGLLDSRIYELQEMIGRAQIIRDPHSSVVAPGSTIEVVDHDGDAWQVESWDAMRGHVLAVASALIESGVKSGDSVILLSENRLEWLYCDFGIQAAGAITVPIYPNTPPEVANTIAADSRAVMAIASNASIAAKLTVAGPLRAVAVMDRDMPGWIEKGAAQLAEVSSRLSRIRPDDLCTIVYTAGTTGVPKGVELAHRNLVDVSRAAVKVHPITDEDRSLSWPPYPHA